VSLCCVSPVLNSILTPLLHDAASGPSLISSSDSTRVFTNSTLYPSESGAIRDHLTAPASLLLVVCPFDFLCLKHLVIDTCFLPTYSHLQPHSRIIRSPHSISPASLFTITAPISHPPYQPLLTLYRYTTSSAMSSEQAFPESDLRSAAQDYKRDADQKAKWGMGAVFTKSGGEKPLPMRRGKRYVPCTMPSPSRLLKKTLMSVIQSVLPSRREERSLLRRHRPKQSKGRSQARHRRRRRRVRR
jgi:hypothetical protein